MFSGLQKSKWRRVCELVSFYTCVLTNSCPYKLVSLANITIFDRKFSTEHFSVSHGKFSTLLFPTENFRHILDWAMEFFRHILELCHHRKFSTDHFWHHVMWHGKFSTFKRKIFDSLNYSMKMVYEHRKFLTVCFSQCWKLLRRM